MLNDVREPPLEEEFAHPQNVLKREPTRPVLPPVGKTVADVTLYDEPITDPTFNRGIAIAVAACVMAIVFAMVMWVWL